MHQELLRDKIYNSQSLIEFGPKFRYVEPIGCTSRLSWRLAGEGDIYKGPFSAAPTASSFIPAHTHRGPMFDSHVQGT